MSKLYNTSLNDLPRNPHLDGLQDYQLGIDPYVKGLVNFLKGTVTPMTVALQGEWGSGKTSLMYKLQDELCEAKGAPYDAVWINTWEYSLMSDSSQALLKIVAKMVTATETNNFTVSKARGILSQLAKGVAKTALGVGTNDTSIIDAVTDIFTSGGESSIGQLQAELKKNIEYRFAHSEKKGIIFFIDDLDRLNPAVAVELLELLKNIFTIDGCVFILAIDYDVVVKGLKGKFGELTDKNEREFRSFFDKIIQVPFAMPVSNYKPYDFIVSSLKSISYIDESDARDKMFMDNIMSATKMTVGNNPRSIKRLMNILSLIKCITLATNTSDKKFGLDKRLGKYVNFVVLSLQVQYPKIFRMLSLEPDFKSWNAGIVKKMNVSVISEEKSEQLRAYKESDEPWEQALYAVCDSDAYLKGRFLDISNLLNRLKEEIEYQIKIELSSHPSDETSTLGDVMREAIQITSVTSFSADDNNPVNLDTQEWTDMVYQFHESVVKTIRKNRPTWKFKQRRNTGNGGFNFFEPHNIEVPFYQRMTGNLPTMEFTVTNGNWIFPSSDTPLPEGMKTREQVIKHPAIANALSELDGFMNLLLQKNDWIVWESIQEYHNEPSNFSRWEIIKAPKVSFKFQDIQRFIDKENVKIISLIIEHLVEFDMKMAEFFNNVFGSDKEE